MIALHGPALEVLNFFATSAGVLCDLRGKKLLRLVLWEKSKGFNRAEAAEEGREGREENLFELVPSLRPFIHAAAQSWGRSVPPAERG